MALSMATLHSLGQHNQNEKQHDFFGHVIPLEQVLLYCDAKDIINTTTAFVGLRRLKLSAMWKNLSCAFASN